MKMSPVGKILTVPFIFALLVVSSPSSADTASTVIERFNETLLQTMENAKTLGYRGRYDKLAPAIKSAFDLKFMTRYAAGRYWRTLSPEQRDELVTAFSRLTIATYANRFDGYSGEKFHLLKEETMPRDTKLVRTELEKSDGDRIKLNYLLRPVNRKWQIIDVFVKGHISELSTKRSEYSSTLKNKGFDGLIAIFEQKIAGLGATNS